MSEIINVIAVDDHKSHNSGVQSMLSKASNIELLGTAQTGEEMFFLLKSLRNKQIDIIILDVEMPSNNGGKDGIELARELKSNQSNYKDIKIICLSMNSQSHILRILLEDIGINGYLTKSETDKEKLIDAIYKVHSGHSERHYLSDDLKKKVARIYSKDDEACKGIDLLTQREWEIIPYIAQGMSNQEIALVLGNISPFTVRNQRMSIHGKLLCNNAAKVATIYYNYKRLHSDDEEGLPNFKQK